MKFTVQNKPLSAFSFSSLTDIVMLLLIFFLLTSQFVIQTGVEVELPGSEHNEKVTTTKYIVSIDSQGAVYLGSEAVSVEELGAKLSILKNESLEEEPLVIRADKTVPIDLIIQVIDAAKAAEITKFTIETEKPMN
jgi:biopolymer transport protein ExbD